VLNFVTTNDITGGNSGSPVVNIRGEIVGVAFDGNQASIAGQFAYDGDANRTVAVSTAAIGEALDKVYGRAALVGELNRR
jgi:S1-C subfamily serine protease